MAAESAMLKIVEKSRVYGNGYEYKHPETGYTSRHPYWNYFLKLVKDHRKANNLPIPQLIEEIVEQDWCSRYPQHCKDESIQPISAPPSPPITHQIKTFAKAMIRWAVQGFKVVSEDQYNTRLQICQACEYWNGMRSLGYGKCRKCGCSGMKLFLPKEKCPIGKW